ncbi:MAG: TetR family transcriptional regulator [Bryobacteraceae bacterium]
MKNVSARAYTSPLRKRQMDATREAIVSTAFAMVESEPGGLLTHEAVAAKAEVAVRTVYRHFPSRAELIGAIWERLKERTGTEFPETEAELLELAPRLYRSFDAHEALVRAFLSSGAGGEVRDRGSGEGRPALERTLAQAARHLDPERRAEVVAVFLALYSAPAWQMMRDRGGISGEQAARAVEWAMRALLDALRRERKKS